jgi:hypothetical protein
LKTTVVLICQGNSVLDLGILSALEAAQGWIKVHTVPDNIAKLLKSIETTHPDVVILSQGLQIARQVLYKDMLETIPPIRILTICAESNHVCINQNQVVQIQKASDIIDLIQFNAFRRQDYLEKG